MAFISANFMKQKLFFLFVFVSMVINAQPRSEYRFVVNSENDVTVFVEEDSLGNSYTIGRGEDTINLGRNNGSDTLVSAGGEDIVMAKYDRDNNLIWKNRIGLEYGDWVDVMTISKGGDIIIAGSISFDVDMDPGPQEYKLGISSGTTNMIAKYNTNGQIIFAKIAEGDIYCLLLDDLGNIYAGGENSNGYVLQKFSSTGTELWNKRGSFSKIKSIRFYGGDSLLVAGEFLGSGGNFAPNGTPWENADFVYASSSGYNIYLSKFSLDGDYRKGTRILNTSGSAYLWDMEVDSNLNVYLAGNYSQFMEFEFNGSDGRFHADPWLRSGFVVKYDSAFDYKWAYVLGSDSGHVDLRKIALSNKGELIAGISSFSDMDFDTGSSVKKPYGTNGYNDLVMVGLDTADGSFEWWEFISGSKSELFMQLDFLDDYRFVATGRYWGTVRIQGRDYQSSEVIGAADAFVGIYTLCNPPYSPYSTMSPEESEICVYSPITLKCSQGEGTLSWYRLWPEEFLGHGTEIEVFVEDVYDNTFIVRDSTCESSDDGWVQINVQDYQGLTFDFPSDSTICVQDTAINMEPYVNIPGGTFWNPPMSGNIFNPSELGEGRHTLTYQLLNSVCIEGATEYVDVVDCITSTNELGLDFSVLPNPNNGTFTISSPNEIKRIAIIDALGRTVYVENNITKYQTTITLEKTGLYFVQIQSSRGAATVKVFVD